VKVVFLDGWRKEAVAIGVLAGAFFAHATRAAAREFDPPSSDEITAVRTEREAIPNTLIALKDSGYLTQEEVDASAVVYSTLPPLSQALFLKLAARVTKAGDKSVLSQSDFLGQTLLRNLATTTSMPFHPVLEPQRDAIVADFLLELSNPGELNQASWGVCGTGLIYPLYVDYPAEAARLVGALLAPEVRARFKDGSIVERAPFSLESDMRPGRSTTERLLMSAFMERANGSLHYCNVCDSHYDPNNGTMPHIGLTNLEISTLYRAVFGLPQSWMERRGNPSEVLMSQLSQESKSLSFVPIALKWNSTAVRPQAYRHAASSAITGIQSHKTLLSEGATPVLVDGYHFVLVTKVDHDAGKVFFRNLHGATSYPAGTILSDPPRIVEDPVLGIESMTLAEVAKRLDVVFKAQDK
jgi:hypothetical protein